MLVWVNDLHIYGAVGKINYRKTKADHHHAFSAGEFLPAIISVSQLQKCETCESHRKP